VFPNGAGNIENFSNILERGLVSAMIAAGIIRKNRAKYTGLHALRFFIASWLINRPVDPTVAVPMRGTARLARLRIFTRQPVVVADLAEPIAEGRLCEWLALRANQKCEMVTRRDRFDGVVQFRSNRDQQSVLEFSDRPG
jgi:hypothetical protein